MTKAQRFKLFIDTPRATSLWTLACEAQGWNKDDRDLRIQMISEAVGRPISSTSELNNTSDVDKAFSFLRMKADNIDAALEHGHSEQGDARRLRWKIAEAKSELRAFVEDVPAYVAEIIRDKFNHGRSHRVEVMTEDDLTPKQLQELLITINARIKTMKDDQANQPSDSSDLSDPSYPFNQRGVIEVFDPENEPF